MCIRDRDYTGENSVAMIGMGASYAFTGTGAERSYGVVNYIDSPYEAIQKIVGEDANISVYAGLDLVGTTVPEEYIYTSEDGEEHGFVRTYGVVAENSGGMFGPVSYTHLLTVYHQRFHYYPGCIYRRS